MNRLLPAPTSRPDHPPQPSPTVPQSARRVGYLDRLALRAGIALITWGRRRSRADLSRERLATIRERQQLREAVERHRDDDGLQMMRQFR